MARPVRQLLVGISLSALGSVASAMAIAAEAQTDAPSPAPRERPTSARVAGMLAAAAPKYSPPVAVEPTATTDAVSAVRDRVTTVERPAPANGIVRLPDYVVRERKPSKLPDPEEVMPRRQLEQIAMQRHLGDEQGLERALSMLTPVHLWRKIPVLGKFPLVTFETNEQRAMRMDEAAKIKARWDALAGLMSPELRPAPKAAPPEG